MKGVKKWSREVSRLFSLIRWIPLHRTSGGVLPNWKVNNSKNIGNEFTYWLDNTSTKVMRIPEGSEFCFSLLKFSKLFFFFFFFFSALSFKAMRLSIGSVVVVLVASKGRVWVCRFFAENTIRRRRTKIFCKTGGLNLHTLKTRIYLCHQNSNTGRKGLILNSTMEKEELLYT